MRRRGWAQERHGFTALGPSSEPPDEQLYPPASGDFIISEDAEEAEKDRLETAVAEWFSPFCTAAELLDLWDRAEFGIAQVTLANEIAACSEHEVREDLNHSRS